MNAWTCPKCGAIASNDLRGFTSCDSCGYTELREMLETLRGLNENGKHQEASDES